MVDKSEIRKEIFHSSGCDADDWLEAAKKNASAFEGAKQALRKAAKDVQAFVAVVQKDLDEGNLEGKEAPEVASYAILQVQRAVDSLMNAGVHYNNRQVAAQGEVAAYDKLVKHFQILRDREAAKIEANKEALLEGEIILDEQGDLEKKAGNGRITGVRPTMSVAAQRRAEAAGEKKVASVEAEVSADAEAAPEKPKRKRRKRKTKKDETVGDAKDS